jgi:hypothetical protein
MYWADKAYGGWVFD